jgi:hypothetical protein
MRFKDILAGASLYVLLALIFIVLAQAQASSQQSIFRWEEIAPKVHILREQTYRSGNVVIEYTAVRFHLGHVNLRLLDTELVVNAGRDVLGGIARVMVDGKARGEILSYSLEGVLARLQKPPIVLVPAGWSKSQRTVDHTGLLRIDGKQLHSFDSRPSMSALLCVREAAEAKGNKAAAPVVFASGSLKSNARASKCPSMVQIGPRIIEEGGKPGIVPGELDRQPRQRVVFAVDDPIQTTSAATSRDASRNGYVLLTHNAVHLYHLQTMLRDLGFYEGGKPHWAINLAGDNHTGMIVFMQGKPEKIEDTLAVIGSVLVVEPRQD